MHPETPPLRPTRWTDPRTAEAYATRIDALDREAAWPALAPLLTNPDPRRGLGRPDATVLELGSGPGHHARHLADNHWTATYAVDISPAIHRNGERLMRDAWIRRVIPRRDGTLPLRRCQCTAALAHLLICHIRQPADILALLGEARRVLRPAAPLVLVEPGELGRDFRFLRYGHPGAAPPTESGEAYPIDYTLADGTMLRTTAYHHTARLLTELIRRAGFRLADVAPLPLPSGDGTPFTLWTAHAE